jgi:hypothetical protein
MALVCCRVCPSPGTRASPATGVRADVCRGQPQVDGSAVHGGGDPIGGGAWTVRSYADHWRWRPWRGHGLGRPRGRPELRGRRRSPGIGRRCPARGAILGVGRTTAPPRIVPRRPPQRRGECGGRLDRSGPSPEPPHVHIDVVQLGRLRAVRDAPSPRRLGRHVSYWRTGRRGHACRRVRRPGERGAGCGRR